MIFHKLITFYEHLMTFMHQEYNLLKKIISIQFFGFFEIFLESKIIENDVLIKKIN